MKRIMPVLIIFTIIISLGIKVINGNWTFRYKSEFDNFFGEGNWEVISEETKESIMFTNYIRSYSNPVFSKRVPGKYKNWNVLFKNKEGKDEIWTVSNHALKISTSKDNSFFGTKKLSNKQALTLEFMYISLGVLSDNIFDEVIKDTLSENESSCIEVSLTYEGGNPSRKYYDSLSKQSWFTVDNIEPENYLSDTTNNFYIMIKVHDYKFEKLTEAERENVINSLNIIKNKLLDKYGDIASFEIYLDESNNMKYKNGVEIVK